ncbi:MAG: hypothetical protein H7A32_00170 [Deltaproteobacteria bacterium]|nr:hypothetical protein [Deltaproteobacteria bacterium]
MLALGSVAHAEIKEGNIRYLESTDISRDFREGQNVLWRNADGSSITVDFQYDREGNLLPVNYYYIDPTGGSTTLTTSTTVPRIACPEGQTLECKEDVQNSVSICECVSKGKSPGIWYSLGIPTPGFDN